MNRFLISLAYDGTGFSGWQLQNNRRTVQGVLEKALSGNFANLPVSVTASGRTDAGVHALKQFAHFDLETCIEPDKLVKALNTLLPADIKVNDAWKVSPDFHARYDALSRTYIYKLSTEPNPFNRFYTAALPRHRIIPQAIEECLTFFLGEHDLSTFAKYNPQLTNYVCHVKHFQLKTESSELIFTVTANRFLHNLVRRMIGTSIRIAHSKLPPSQIKKMIAARNPSSDLIFTAPPQGLYLADVQYKFLS